MSIILDWAEGWAGRARCRLFRRHGKACRGRPDHVRDGRRIDPDRW
jgi:hypothetical protein